MARRRIGLLIVVAGSLAACSGGGMESAPAESAPNSEAATTVASTSTSTTTPPAPTPYEAALATFIRPLERSTADRPDESDGPMVKFIYVVPSFATDRERDINGEIGRYVFHTNEWLASQNGGFGVRVDTYDGAIDVSYAEIETTPEEWESWFAESLAPAAEALRAQGWPIGRGVETNGDDLYYVVWETFAGNYLKTGASGGGCRGVIDGQNAGYRMVGYAVANPDGTPCAMDYGRFPFGGSIASQQSWLETNGQPDISFIDHTMQFMRFLPDCGNPQSPRDGEMHVVPGTDKVEIRGGFIRDLLEPHDPVAMRMPDADPQAIPTLDSRHDTYFHITTDRLARLDCNSDAGRHPMWSDTPFYPSSPHVPRRSVLDRPDDVEGVQLHAVYVRAEGVSDRALDTGLEIPAALRDLDAWWREQTGGSGIRIDTYQGHIDITYLPLPMTPQEFVESGTCLGERCPSDADFERILQEAGYDDPEKWYAFFYDGGISPEGLCGGARNDSRTLLINLTDFSQGRCDIPWRADQLDTWSLGLIVGHELLHTLSAVCPEAADRTEGFHSAEASDLMYGQADGPGIVLDVGRDSYWGSRAPAGCDVSTHPIFTTDVNPFSADVSIDDVPVGTTDLVMSDRTWWLVEANEDETPSANASSGSLSPKPNGSDPDCPVSSGEVAATVTGFLRAGIDGSDQPVGLIWANDPNRCVVARTMTTNTRRFSLEIPVDAHVEGAWEEGGGYCVVWDENGDGVFDSISSEPLNCFSSVRLGSTVQVDI